MWYKQEKLWFHNHYFWVIYRFRSFDIGYVDRCHLSLDYSIKSIDNLIYQKNSDSESVILDINQCEFSMSRLNTRMIHWSMKEILEYSINQPSITLHFYYNVLDNIVEKETYKRFRSMPRKDVWLLYLVVIQSYRKTLDDKKLDITINILIWPINSSYK